MRRFLTTLLAGMLVLAIVAPAVAWEFDMKGEYEYRFKYFARMGNSDLFGSVAAQDSGAVPFIGLAGPNTWNNGAVINPPTNTGGLVGTLFSGVFTPPFNGVAITRGGFSKYGSDAHYSDNRLTLYPRSG